jgi:hypothetical protein
MKIESLCSLSLEGLCEKWDSYPVDEVFTAAECATQEGLNMDTVCLFLKRHRRKVPDQYTYLYRGRNTMWVYGNPIAIKNLRNKLEKAK